MTTDCPKFGRRAYPTEGFAWAGIRDGRHGGARMLPYRCVCGSWHVTDEAEARAMRAAGR